MRDIPDGQGILTSPPEPSTRRTTNSSTSRPVRPRHRPTGRRRWKDRQSVKQDRGLSTCFEYDATTA
jgi:hypothetical protein